MRTFILPFLFICFCFISNFSVAQTTTVSTIKLKSGKILKGEIVEKDPGVSLLFKEENGTKLRVSYDDIERITTSNPESIKPKQTSEAAEDEYDPFLFLFEMKYGMTAPSPRGHDFGFRLVPSFYLADAVSIGLTAGVDVHQSFYRFPLGVDIRFFVDTEKFRPFLMLQGGMGLCNNDNYQGVFGQAGIGIKEEFFGNRGLYLLASLKGQQELVAVYYGSYASYTGRGIAKYFNFTLGFSL